MRKPLCSRLGLTPFPQTETDLMTAAIVAQVGSPRRGRRRSIFRKVNDNVQKRGCFWQSLDATAESMAKKSAKTNAPAQRSPRFEPLEARKLLSVCQWTGDGCEQPIGILRRTLQRAAWQCPQCQRATRLVFTERPAPATYNDFAAGTSFSSIEFQNSGFTLGGNSLQLAANITVDSGVSGSETISSECRPGRLVDVQNSAAALTLSGVVSGSNCLTKIDSGTLIVSGSNTYSGGTSITGGTVQTTTPTALAAARLPSITGL